MRHAASTLITLMILLAGGAALYNVFSENFDVARMASDTVCADQGPACRMQATFMERSPVAQTFTFDSLDPRKRGHLVVRCTREWILAGTYTCAVRPLDLGFGLLPMAMPSGVSGRAAPSASGRVQPHR